MRGAEAYNEALFSTVKLDEFVPQTHPLRPILQWLNEALAKMDAKFSAMVEADAKAGRPSIAPEKLMRAMLLQVQYSVRCERQLVEPIAHDLLLRGFVGLAIEDTVCATAVFSNIRDRLIAFDAVTDWFNATVEMADKRGLPPQPGRQRAGQRCRWVCRARCRRVHAVGRGQGRRQITVDADKGYDTRGFVKACRTMNVTPTRRAEHQVHRRQSDRWAHDATRRLRAQPGQANRAVLRLGQDDRPDPQVMVQGLEKVDQLLTLTMAAYNLTRLRSLAALRPQLA